MAAIKARAQDHNMRLDDANHEFLESLRCVTYNDALTKVVEFVKSKPDFYKELGELYAKK